MSDFDPDAYLKAKASAFDPDAYLKAKNVAAKPQAEEPPTAGEAEGLSRLQTLAKQYPQEDAKTIFARYKAGERGQGDHTLEGKIAPRSGGAKLLMALRGKLPLEGTDALARGVGQGATLGFADEMAGGVGGASDYLGAKLRGDQAVFGELYTKNRDESRALDAKYRAAFPKEFTGGEIGGGALLSLAPGVGALNAAKTARQAIAGGTALGMLTGAGSSEADSLEGVAKDTAIGGTLGGGLGGLAHGGAKAVGAVGRYAEGKLSAVAEKLKAMGVDVESAITRTGRSEAGNAATDAYKQASHMRNFVPESEWTPAERELVDKLEKELGQKARAKLPESAAAKDAKAAAYRELIDSEEQRAADYAAQKGSAAELKKQAGDRLRRYAIRSAVGAGAGALVGGDAKSAAMGGTAGLAFAPMVNSFRRLATLPATQRMAYGALANLGAVEPALQAAGRANTLALEPEVEALIAALRGRRISPAQFASQQGETP